MIATPPPSVASAQVAPRYGPFDGFGRGVFVFGGLYVVDLGWGVQYFDMALSGHTRAGPRGVSWPPEAVICSDEAYHCVSSPDRKAAVRVATPRICRRLKIGEEWSVGGVRMIVLTFRPGMDLQHIDHPYPDSYLLAEVGRKDVVYRYETTHGVTAIAISFSPKADLPEAVRSGAIEGPTPFIDTVPAWRWHNITTPDTFGACSGPDIMKAN